MMDDSELEDLGYEERDYDTMNDETFGDTIEEFNWDDVQIPPKRENNLDENQFIPTGKVFKTWEDEYDAVEEEMEANVSKLLLDDMEDCETQDDGDKASSLYYAEPKPLDHKVYTAGAGPGWVEDAEGEDRNSLLGSASVWGTSSLLKSHLQSSKPENGNQNERNPEKSKARPMNLQELEEEFFKENEALSRKKTHKVIRAEDLERELKEQSNGPRVKTGPLPRGPEPTQQFSPMPFGMYPSRPPPGINAFPMPPALNLFVARRPGEVINVKQVLREHGYAQDFNRNARIFADEIRNKSFPNLPQYMPNMPLHPRMQYSMPIRPQPISFTGLMTERERQRIRNIQIIQLQNDHPHKNDFYYQMYLIRTNPLNKDLRDKSLNKLFPKEADQSNKLDYKPLQFDKSLGKIQASSAQAPKKIFDIDNNDKVPAASQQVNPGYHRMTLIAIEQTFRRLQLVEELLIKLKVLRSVQLEHCKDRLRSTRMSVFNALMYGNLPRILNYRKGRVLVFKAIPRLEGHHRVALLGTVLGYFDLWTKTIETDADYSIVLKTILSAVLELSAANALNLTGQLGEHEVENLLKSRLGLSIFNILTYVADRYRNLWIGSLEDWEKYSSCMDKIDWSIIPCVLTPKYIDEMMKMSINKCKSVQDGRLSFEEWAKMENSVYIRQYENPDTLGLFGFPRDVEKFWQNTNVLWIDDDLVSQDLP